MQAALISANRGQVFMEDAMTRKPTEIIALSLRVREELRRRLKRESKTEVAR